MSFVDTLWEAYKSKKRECDTFLNAITAHDSHLNVGARIARGALIAKRELSPGERAWLDAERARQRSEAGK